MAKGNAILIGLGGSGRQSLTKLSCFIRDFEFFEIEMTKLYNYDNWKTDITKLMIIAGNFFTCFSIKIYFFLYNIDY